jgi:hypothetical protein
MKWVTRARPKTDRIACPWLIRRFIDPDAEILYIPKDQVLNVARQVGARSFESSARLVSDCCPSASEIPDRDREPAVLAVCGG